MAVTDPNGNADARRGTIERVVDFVRKLFAGREQDGRKDAKRREADLRRLMRKQQEREGQAREGQAREGQAREGQAGVDQGRAQQEDTADRDPAEQERQPETVWRPEEPAREAGEREQPTAVEHIRDRGEALQALLEAASERRTEERPRFVRATPRRARPHVVVQPSEQAARAAAAIAAEVADVVSDELGRGYGSDGTGGLTVHFHPTERRIGTVRGPKRAAEKGLAITRFDRLPVDGRVFDRKRPGGSVLVDHSGSMSLSYDDVAKAIETFPALTIARYSGPTWRPMGSMGEGTLCILAEHGLLGELGDCPVGGGGNDVDIESLSWLAKQPEPRIWVSDGGVCGGLVEMLGADQARDVITSLCQRKGIVRVATFEDAVKVLRRGITRGIAVEPRDADFLPSLER